MTKELKVRWRLWAIAAAVVIAGAIACAISMNSVVAPLYLQTNETIDLSMFRLFPDEMHLSIHFDRTPGQKRPELGNLKYKENEGVREFPNPGVPIKLLIQNEGAGTIYEALPANAFGILRRKLVPFVDDGSPAHFQWPPIESRIPTGHSNFSVTVLEVGQQLAGEKVTLVVSAPISLKKVAPHYGYALLSWFMYWPLYSLFLVAYGATLLWKSFRHSSNMAVERDASPKSGSRPLP